MAAAAAERAFLLTPNNSRRQSTFIAYQVSYCDSLGKAGDAAAAAAVWKKIHGLGTNDPYHYEVIGYWLMQGGQAHDAAEAYMSAVGRPGPDGLCRPRLHEAQRRRCRSKTPSLSRRLTDCRHGTGGQSFQASCTGSQICRHSQPDPGEGLMAADLGRPSRLHFVCDILKSRRRPASRVNRRRPSFRRCRPADGVGGDAVPTPLYATANQADRSIRNTS